MPEAPLWKKGIIQLVSVERHRVGCALIEAERMWMAGGDPLPSVASTINVGFGKLHAFVYTLQEVDEHIGRFRSHLESIGFEATDDEIVSLGNLDEDIFPPEEVAGARG